MKKVLCSLAIALMMTGSGYACETPEELIDNYFMEKLKVIKNSTFS